jgi:hypothetical protein
MDEARGEEAAQSGQQQECILSGGVYLRHRLKSNFLLFFLLNYNTRAKGVPVLAYRRAGVQETFPLSDLTQ